MLLLFPGEEQITIQTIKLRRLTTTALEIPDGEEPVPQTRAEVWKGAVQANASLQTKDTKLHVFQDAHQEILGPIVAAPAAASTPKRPTNKQINGEPHAKERRARDQQHGDEAWEPHHFAPPPLESGSNKKTAFHQPKRP
jgi:hypothetical protein